MLNTYIKNKGITQTLISNGNNENHFNQINWDADYDGEFANISLTSNTDGNNNYTEFKLDNEDLAKILNMQSVNMPIHKRLQNDFPLSKMSTISTGDELIIPLTIYKKKHRHNKSKKRHNTKKLKNKHHNTRKSHKSTKSTALIDLIKNSV